MDHPDSIDAIMRQSDTERFTAQEPARALIEEILDVARRAPSGTNTQPWTVFVLQGAALARLVQQVSGPAAALPDDPQARSRFRALYMRLPGIGQVPTGDPPPGLEPELFAALEAPAHDPARAALARYFRCNDAPVALVCTISDKLGLGSVLDYGAFLRNVELAARARGLGTCLQVGWKGFADILLPFVGAPADALMLAVMALGYGAAPAPDAMVTAVAEFTTWHR